jgi:hypothetical protein
MALKNARRKGSERGRKKESGQEFLPAWLPRRPKWPRVAVLVYFPEVVEVLAVCEFALGMLM